jgi:hypothetical protein
VGTSTATTPDMDRGDDELRDLVAAGAYDI